jgi:hypothetical protein
MIKKNNVMLRLSCIISGDDFQLVKFDTPASKKKIITLVSALCIPVFMWFTNVFLLTSQTLQKSWFISLVAATLASFLIFSIERNIIMANGSKAIMIIRIVLGFLIASLGSIAFDEVLFKNDIDHQVSVSLNNLINKRVEDVQKKYVNQLAKNETNVKKLYNDWIVALDNASGESDGSKGSGLKGVSQIAKLKISIAQQQQEEYISAKKEADNFIKKVEKEKKEIKQTTILTYQNNALLLRIQAMFDLLKNDNWMLVVYILVTSILFVLEFIVVFLKMKLPKTNYERKVEMIERIGEERIRRLLKTYPSYIDDVTLIPSLRSVNNRVKKANDSSIFN